MNDPANPTWRRIQKIVYRRRLRKGVPISVVVWKAWDGATVVSYSPQCCETFPVMITITALR